VHLGYDKQDPVVRNQGNSRNGKPAQDCVNSGEVAIEVPRDRDGGFEPVIVAKRVIVAQRRRRRRCYLIHGAPQTGHAWRKVVPPLAAAG
jgi:transposase-like protein